MKKIIILFLSFIAFTEAKAQSAIINEVEMADKLFEESFTAKNVEAMFQNVNKDCIFYGTDASERWDMPSFRTMITNGLKNGMPTMQVISREIMVLNGDNSAVIIKKINWAIFKTELREIAIYEKQREGWKMKVMSLNLEIPNQKTKALNELLGSK